jgi:hypothetical protein
VGKEIEIVLPGQFLKRGESNRINIAITFPSPTKVRGIRAEFAGIEKTSADYTTTETDSDGKSRTVTRTATEYVEIVKEEFLLMGEPRKGFFGRIGDSMKTVVGGGEHEEVAPGEMTFEVDVFIPKDALASFKGKKSEVSYSMSVSVDIPIKVDWHKKQELTLQPEPVDFSQTNPVHIVFPDDTGRSFWNKKFGKDVRINLAVDRDLLTIGEQALAMLTVETPEPLKVKKIEVALVATESTSAQGHNDLYHHRIEMSNLDSPGLITNETVEEFEIVVPESEAPFTQQGTNFNVAWVVEIRLHIPWAADPIVSAPIKVMAANAT